MVATGLRNRPPMSVALTSRQPHIVPPDLRPGSDEHSGAKTTNNNQPLEKYCSEKVTHDQCEVETCSMKNFRAFQRFGPDVIRIFCINTKQTEI